VEAREAEGRDSREGAGDGEAGARLEEDVRAVHRLQGDCQACHGIAHAGGEVAHSGGATDLGVRAVVRIWGAVRSGEGVGCDRGWGCGRRELGLGLGRIAACYIQ
jgi:hypothetical protein